MRTGVAFVALAAALVAATLSACGGDGDSGAGPARIYFYSDRTGNNDVFSMKPDGSDLQQLTDDAASDYEARPSPDGARVVFVSDRDGTSQIYTMNADGSDQTRLTFSAEDEPTVIDDYPQWSPDARRVVFQRSLDEEGRRQADIYVIDVETGEETQITDTPTWDSTPSFTPDGERIVFESNRLDDEGAAAGDFNIWRVAVDGSGLERLTDSPGSDLEAKTSPDGRYVAFSSDRDGNDEIYVMDADGGNVRRLTDNPASDRCPNWLGNDTLVFFTNRDGNNEIYSMKIDGSDLRRLTDDPAQDQTG